MALIAQYKLDETSGTTIVDSVSAINGTSAGTPTLNQTASPGDSVGTAILFDGTNDLVDLGTGNFEFDDTDSFSVSAWIKTTHTANDQMIIGKFSSSGSDPGWGLTLLSSNRLQVDLFNNVSNRIVQQATLPGLVDGNWHHVVATYDGSSTAAGAKLYVDGVEITPDLTTDTLSMTLIDVAENAYIASRSGSTSFFNGTLDEVRVYDHELTANEVVVLSTPQAISHYPLDETSGTTIADAIGSVNGTSSGTPTLAQPLLDPNTTGTSIEFDGTDDYVNFGNNFAFERTDPFSISTWLRLDTLGGYTVVSKRDAALNTGYSIGFAGTGEISLFMQGSAGGSSRLQILSAERLSVGETYNLVITYDGSSTVAGAKMYFNGTLLTDTLGTDTLGSSIVTTDPFLLGVFNDTSSGFIDGRMDELKVFDVVLEQDEISAAALGSLPFPISHYKLDETSGTTIVDSVSGVDGTSSGTPTLAQPLLDPNTSGTSIDFDGTNDYVDFGNNFSFERTDTFSLSFWINMDALPGSSYTVISKRDPIANTGYSIGFNSDGTVGVFMQGSAGAGERVELNSVEAASATTTHNLIVTYDGSSTVAGVKMYLDRVLLTNSSITDTLASSIVVTDPFLLGVFNDTSTGFVDGRLDEVKIFNYVLTQAQVNLLLPAITANESLSEAFSLDDTVSNALEDAFEETITEDVSFDDTISETQGTIYNDTITEDAAFNDVLSEDVTQSPATPYSDLVLGKNPHVYFKFDETSGTTAVNLGTEPQDGTYLNTPTLGETGLVTSEPGTSVLLDGVDQAISYSILSGSGYSAYTIELSIKPAVNLDNTLATDVGLYTNVSNTNGFELRYESVAQALVLENKGSSNAESASHAVTFTAGTTYYIAVTWHAPTDAVEFYIDGVNVGSGTIVQSPSANLGDPRYIGRLFHDSATAGYLNATVDNFALYPSRLSAAQITSHFESLTVLGWDVSKKSANTVLSNGDLTVTIPTNEWGIVHTTKEIGPGERVYTEITIDSQLQNAVVGITDITDPLVTGAPTGVGIRYDIFTGDVSDSGGVITTLPTTFVAGSVIGLIINTSNDTIIFRLPSGDSAPIAIPTAASYYVSGGVLNTAQLTINVGASSFNYVIPAGFTSCDGSQTGLPLFSESISEDFSLAETITDDQLVFLVESLSEDFSLDEVLIDNVISPFRDTLSQIAQFNDFVIEVVDSPFRETLSEDVSLDDTLTEVVFRQFNDTLSEDVSFDDTHVDGGIFPEREVGNFPLSMSETVTETVDSPIRDTLTDIADFKAVVGTFLGDIIFSLSDGFSVDENTTASIISPIIEVINHLDALTLVATQGVECSELSQISGILKVVFNESHSGTIEVDGSIQDKIAYINSLIEIISINATGGDQANAAILLSDIINIIDDAYPTEIESVLEQLTLDEITVLAKILSNPSVVEDVTLSDTFTALLFYQDSLADVMSVDDVITLQSILQSSLEEEMVFMELSTGQGATYEGWVMNPDTFSVWNYSNFNFNSFAHSGQRTLAANSTGLHLIGGSRDESAFIVSKLKTAAMDFGSSNKKQMHKVYLGLTGTGGITLIVKNDEKVESTYKLSQLPSNSEAVKIDVGKGLVGRKWQFELIDSDSDEFDLTDIELYPIVLGRKTH